MNKKQLTVACVMGILVISQLISVSFVQAQNIYRNTERHFSFIIPEKWIQYSKEVMGAFNKYIGRLSNGKTKYDAGFHKEGMDNPHLYIQIYKSKRVTESEKESMIDKAKLQKIARKQGNKLDFALSGLGIKIEFGQLYYDVGNNIFYVINKSVQKSGNLLGINAMILSNHGAVNIYFCSTEENFNNDLVYFNQIINSFSFDQGFQY